MYKIIKINKMKNFLLLMILTFVSAEAFAQCTPDAQYSVAGIYPDSATGLSAAMVGQSYSENITIISPTDTVVDVFGTTLSVTIDNIDLTSVSGLPNNFSYACDPPSCSFPGGSTKCAELFSTIDPTSADIGLYQVIFETTTYVSGIPILNTTTQDDIIDYYYLEILPTSTSVFNLVEDHTFDLKAVFPNPVIGNAKIQFVSGSSEKVILNIYNLLGEEVESRTIYANRGINTLDVSTISFNEGIYLYSINNGEQLRTRRMVVKN
jgi:hypothetical protein